MIDRRSLVRALGHEDLADWVVIQRDQELAVVDDDNVQRTEQRSRWQLTLHADTPAGRGTAHLAIDANEQDPDKLVAEAAILARLSAGPAWATIPPAAPARVELADPTLATGEPIAAALLIAKLVPRRPGAVIRARVSVLRESVSVQARQSFHTEWSATLARIEALVTQGAHGLSVVREARRSDQLGVVAAIDDAIADLRRLASAVPYVAGPCAVILTSDALLHGELGVWDAFVSQADPVIARQGLTRYHPPAVIAAGAESVAEPLSITSDGALAFGVRSSPLGDEGDAVRRFPLVTRGIAAGLGLTPREAALRQTDPNGGVRNLIVDAGSWDERVSPDQVRVIEVRRLRGLEIDPFTGDADLELALAVDRASGAPFSGGALRLDLIDVLAKAKRSARTIRRGPYVGPAAVLIDRADLI
ncbi:MAG: metallopeptidase TldD-related protein [Deltaproteobacteria bacterium]